MADPVVHITAGIPDSGTGNITTLGQTLADGANATLGVTTGAKVITDAAGTFQQYFRGMVTLLAGTLTVATHAVTQSGNWVLSAGSAIIGLVKITDGTNTAAVKAASTAPAATDPAMVVAISPNSVNANGRAAPIHCAPVVSASQAYNTVAASQTKQALTGGSGGAAGDWLDFLLIVPATTSPGVVGLYDSSSGTEIIVFAGGASSVASLVPFAVPIRAVSATGAWCITTGSNVSVVASGNFT
jgi:hypothetical protein